jgi:hypothetical protein
VRSDILCGVGLVVHEEEVDFASVVDEEHLVARWCEVLGLPVATIANLYESMLVHVSFSFLFAYRSGDLSFGMIN